MFWIELIMLVTVKEIGKLSESDYQSINIIIIIGLLNHVRNF